MANETIIRGRLLAFLREPRGVDDKASYLYEEDGALLVRAGKITARGDYVSVSRKAGEGAAVIDHRPHLLLPGFIDAHVHYPQMQVIASYGAELLDCTPLLDTFLRVARETRF